MISTHSHKNKNIQLITYHHQNTYINSIPFHQNTNTKHSEEIIDVMIIFIKTFKKNLKII